MLLRYGNKLVLSPLLQSAPEHQTLRLSAEETPAAIVPSAPPVPACLNLGAVSVNAAQCDGAWPEWSE